MAADRASLPRQRRRPVVAMPLPQLTAELRVIAMTAAAVFRTRGYTWGGFSNEAHIPDVNEIEKALRERLKTVVEEGETYSSSSGRFFVEPGDDGELVVLLEVGTLEGFFALDECSECYGVGYLSLDDDERCPACDGAKMVVRTEEPVAPDA